MEVSDKLIDSQAAENKLLSERLATEKKTSALALELAAARQAEAESYRAASDAKSEALKAKDEIIANKNKEIEIYKKRGGGLMDAVRKIATGVVIGLIVKSL